MIRVLIFALTLVCCSAPAAFAVTTITAGVHSIPDVVRFVTIDILISDDGLGPPLGPDVPAGQITFVDLYLQVADGIYGPPITKVDLIGPGLIFHEDNSGQLEYNEPYLTPGLQPYAGTGILNAPVSANGVLARLTIDTSPAFRGPYPFRGPYTLLLTNSLGSTYLGDIPVVLVDGLIYVVPEPASIVMGLMGAAALGAVVIRKRRAGG